MDEFEKASANQTAREEPFITLFLAGDVMTGRGIDQVLPHPGDPTIHESYLKSAKKYEELAEEANGPIGSPVPLDYIWGDALAELERAAPDVRIINLETSVTASEDYWDDKEIHYRMNPGNIGSLTAARVDFCSLANNHILDWGYSGLAETLETLRRAKVKFAGAGRNLGEARAPAVMEVPGKGRVIVFSLGTGSSGIPPAWGATEDRAGVNLLPDLSPRTVQAIGKNVRAVKREKDIVVASIHWGRNWGYEVSPDQVSFAHGLIEEAGVDLIHGHSSHHVKGIEVYRGKLILYGCGDFLNDYEGIRGYEVYRNDLALMYFVRLDPGMGKLARLWMIPMQIKNFRLNRASAADARWLKEVLNREGKKFGTRVKLDEESVLRLPWGKKQAPYEEEEGILKDRLQLIFEWYRGMVERETGRLLYLYYPGENYISSDRSPIREIGSIWDLEILSDFLGRQELQPLIARTLAGYRRMLIRPDGYRILSPRLLGEPSSIAHSAFLILALLRSRLSGREEEIVQLADGILAQQREDGSYKIFFGPEKDSGLELYPAEAMLALLEVYGLTGDRKYLQSVERGFLYYRSRYFETGGEDEEGLVFFANWQSQFCRLLYQDTEKADLKRALKNYMLGLHDRIIENGFYRKVNKLPERQSSVEVASALEGLNEAYAVASQGRDHRLDRYKESLCLALSYLLQVQCTVRCAEKEKGGLGFSLTNRNQRIDVTGHLVNGLIKSLQNRVSC